MKAVVFDMDGVLFDTEKLCMESWMKVAGEEGLKGMEEVFSAVIGLNANDSRKVVLDAYGQDFRFELFREKTSAWMKDYIKKNGLPVKPGVTEILTWLREQKWVVGLASSTNSASVISHLERAGIREYFQAVITGDMVEHSKPLPDIYLLACRELHVKPFETYAIEDSPNGIRSAYAAGMQPLMVPDMIAPDEELRSLSRGVFRDLAEVLEFLREL